MLFQRNLYELPPYFTFVTKLFLKFQIQCFEAWFFVVFNWHIFRDFLNQWFKRSHCFLPKVQEGLFSGISPHFETKCTKNGKLKILPLHGLFFESWKLLNSNNGCRRCSLFLWIHVSGALETPCCFKAN